MFIPSIATWFPEHLGVQSRAIQTEEVDDSMNRLEDDPTKQMQEQQGEEEEEEKKGDALEKDDMKPKK